MAEYSRLASGQVVSNGGATPVIIPFLPNVIEISNSTRAANTGVTRAWWSTDMGQGAGFLVTSNGTEDLTTYITSATGGGFSTFQGGIGFQFGPSVAITAMTLSGTAPEITTGSAHNLVSGNVVIFQNLYETTTTGQIQLTNIPFVVTVIDGTHFTIAVNNNVTGYTAISGSGVNTPSMKQVLYPNLYAPNLSWVVAVNTSTNVITTSAPHNFQVGQQVAFRIPTAFGTTQLNSLPNILIPGSPNYYFVSAVGSSTTFTLSQSLASYTTFTTSVAFAAAAAGGFNWPQVVAVGDANSGSLLTNYLSPSFYNGSGTGKVSTINGPAIAGAFCNNTSQGFIIGASVAGTAADVIYWNAYMMDLQL